jgi:hypothetical protein
MVPAPSQRWQTVRAPAATVFTSGSGVTAARVALNGDSPQRSGPFYAIGVTGEVHDRR